MKKTLFLLSIIFLFSSCSSSYFKKYVTKHMKKNTKKGISIHKYDLDYEKYFILSNKGSSLTYSNSIDIYRKHFVKDFKFNKNDTLWVIYENVNGFSNILIDTTYSSNLSIKASFRNTEGAIIDISNDLSENITYKYRNVKENQIGYIQITIPFDFTGYNDNICYIFTTLLDENSQNKLITIIPIEIK